jgi:hypothetical protein
MAADTSLFREILSSQSSGTPRLAAGINQYCFNISKYSNYFILQCQLWRNKKPFVKLNWSCPAAGTQPPEKEILSQPGR